VEKKLRSEIEKIEATHPEAEFTLWAQDEQRLGLKPVNRMMWVPKGEQPIASVNWKYQWLWLAGFVEPASGETYWWTVPKLNIEIFARLLADFAEHFQLGTHRRFILVLDQAGWHTSGKLEVPEGIHLLFLPPRSPELQPAERLWPSINEAVANRSFSSLDELEDTVIHRCQVLLRRPEFIQGLTGFHWWMDAIA